MEIKHQPAARVILAAVAVFYAIGLSALTWSSWRIALIVFAIGCMALLMFMTVFHVTLLIFFCQPILTSLRYAMYSYGPPAILTPLTSAPSPAKSTPHPR